MRVTVARNSREMGEEAARLTAEALCSAVRKKGWARLALTTGISQVEALAALTRQQVPWQQVEVFQVCERADAAEEDPGCCRRVLKERFARRLPVAKVHYLEGTEESRKAVSREIRRAPVDVMLVGIGDQGQIGFNAAPADFEADEPYIRIEPQGEAASVLITLSVQEMMRVSQVIACAPYGIHAGNVFEVMTHRLTPALPATALKGHRKFELLLDRESAAKISVSLAAECNPELEEYRLLGGPEREE